MSPARTKNSGIAPPTQESKHGRAWWLEAWGWFFLVNSGLVALALLGNHTAHDSQHWLGPYLGRDLNFILRRGLGNLPSLLMIPLLALAGLWLHTGAFNRYGTRFLGCLGFLLGLAVLLNLRVADLAVLTAIHLEQNGGLLGYRMHLHLLQPIFYQAKLGPLLLMLLLTLLSLFFALGIPVGKLKSLANSLFTKIQVVFANISRILKASIKTSPSQDNAWRDPETTTNKKISAGQVNPLDGKSLGKHTIPNKEKPELATIASSKIGETREVIPTEVPNLPDGGAIASLEALLENAHSMDPRVVRKLRDELADLRRTKEINEWEDRKAGKLVIEGLVQKGGKSKNEVQTPSYSIHPVQGQEPLADNTVVQTRQIPERPVDEKLSKREPTILPFESYKIPAPADILPQSPVQAVDYTAEELENISASLELQLENFRVKGKVVGIATGPVITRFELEPGPGVKVARFAGLADDLALSLKANSIRVLAPIPGKSAVGIEIPNRRAHLVYCRDIFESTRFAPRSDNVQIALGKDITGNAFVMDLARAPHLLIAGQTGSGKSVCINTIMASILFSKSPDDLRMILVDPKVVELKPYEKIPHLLHPVVTDPDTAVQALKWACWEMDRRYEVLARAKVRNLAGFNAKHIRGELTELLPPEEAIHMPFIVIVIDELADLMMVAGKEVEVSIARLAQKARAVGVHLILATQRPSVNVITGTIKANLPTRISFKVASHIDARTIMDRAGAEKLLGRGDMLFRSIDDPEPSRVHGAFLSDEEAEQIAKSCSSQYVNYPQLQSFQFEDSGEQKEGEELGPRDELFWDAAELALHTGGISTSAVQRRMQVGYARAGRIVDQLEKAGIVGKEKGSKPRDVLVDEEGLANLRRTAGY